MDQRLFLSLLSATSTEYAWSDALINPGMPMMLITPCGNVPFGGHIISAADIKELAQYVVELAYGPGNDVDVLLQSGSVKPAIDIEGTNSNGDPATLRFRFTIVRALADGNIMVVVRKIPTVIPSLSQMGMALTDFTDILSGAGIILVTGPTRNGKSTVVASMVEALRELKNVNHIVKIEDPIEFRHPPDQNCIVTPREIGTHAASYKEAAEDALRMAPGAITIGEMREPSDALACLNVGESGHLVMATMQSTTVEGALLKMRALTSHQHGTADAIANSVKAVIRTALVPTRDGLNYQLAYEWIINSGAVNEAMLGWDTKSIRNNLRQRRLGNQGGSLNDCLQRLVHEERITPEAATSASNDQSQLNLTRVPGFVQRSYR